MVRDAVGDSLPSYLGDSILTLCAFDTDAAKIICGSITPEHFDSPMHRKVAQRIFDYVENFDTAPAMHLDDILDDLAFGKDDRKSAPYKQILENLFDHQESVNKEYVLSNIAKFVKQQTLKSGVAEAATLIKDGKLEMAEDALNKALKQRQISFDGGTTFYSDNTLDFLNADEMGIPMDIPIFDDKGICPAPKELMTFMAPAGRGKTWFMIHCGKSALLHRKKVLHISLEMSEEKCMQRYIQSFFSISKNEVKQYIKTSSFEKDEFGNFVGIDFHNIDPKDVKSLKDENIYEHINRKLGRGKYAKHSRRYQLRIKQFPTNQLTIRELTGYLDALERHQKFVPDVIILDYADLMKIDSANQRVETGRIYQDIRGIAVERNLAMITASQSNRSAEDVKEITTKHFAEDYSKAAISDNIITYNQTDSEKKARLARLLVAKARNDEAFFSVLIAQAYEIGQFCLDSARMKDAYWEQLEELEDED